jgi:hypothetical protein
MEIDKAIDYLQSLKAKGAGWVWGFEDIKWSGRD